MIKKILIILILVLWFLGFVLFAKTVDLYGVEKTYQNIKTDAVIVLTGGRDRIGTSLMRLKEGLSERVFISGAFKNTKIKELLNHYDDIELDEEKVKKIEIGYEARNTEENAIEVNQWINDNDIKSILLITSDYHMPRSLVEIKSVNDKVEIYNAPVYSQYVSRQWWKSPKTFFFLMGEYNKFLYAYIRAKIKNIF